MNRPLRWAVGLAGLSIAAVLVGRLMEKPLVGALLAALTAPGIVIALYEILRASDERADVGTRRSVFVAMLLLAVPFVVLLSFARLLGVDAPWHLSR